MKGSTISISPGKINVSYVAYHNFDGKYFNVYIPAFDMHFSTTDESRIEEKGKAMVKSFFHHKEEKNPLKALVLDLHKLGFRAKDHDLFMKNILNHKVSEGSFKFDDNKFAPKGESISKEYSIAA